VVNCTVDRQTFLANAGSSHPVRCAECQAQVGYASPDKVFTFTSVMSSFEEG
jgi:hypothetical protein